MSNGVIIIIILIKLHRAHNNNRNSNHLCVCVSEINQPRPAQTRAALSWANEVMIYDRRRHETSSKMFPPAGHQAN